MTDFFDAASYVEWVRGLVAATERRPQAVGLFDASMEEPSELLRAAIDRVLDEPGRPRMHSVMDAGNPRVVQALCARYGVGRDQLLCTTGALTGMSLVFEALAGPGGQVLMERPHLDTLSELAVHAGAGVDYFGRDPFTGVIDFQDLAAKLRTDTRLVVLTNLHNPTGALATDAELLRVAELVEGTGARIVVDEVYADFAHRLGGGRSAVALSDVFVAVNSLSKVYGLSALKCGWIVGAPEVVARIAPVHGLRDFGISKLTHAVASLVLEEEGPFIDHVRQVLGGARPVVEAWSAGLRAEGLLQGELPAVGCMYFPRLPRVADTRAFAAALWRDHAVAAAPGELFQSPGHIRIGFARPVEQLAPALAHLGAALRAWAGDERPRARA